MPAASDPLKRRQRDADSCAQHAYCQAAANLMASHVASSQRKISMTHLIKYKELTPIQVFKQIGRRNIWKNHRLPSTILCLESMRITDFPTILGKQIQQK